MTDIALQPNPETGGFDLALSPPVTAPPPPNLALRIQDDGQEIAIPHIGDYEELVDFTIEYRILKLGPGPTPNSNREIIRKFTENSDRMWFFHLQPEVPNNGQLVYSHGDGVGRTEVAVTLLATGVWTPVAVSKKGDDFSFYVKGEFVRERNIPGAVTGNTAPLSIRFHPAGGPDFVIDEVRIWNTARTSLEIAAAMNKPVSPLEPGLIGYYRFDGTNTSVALDSSTKANHGTITGATRVDGDSALQSSPPLAPSDLATDDGLNTAVIVSLYSDARAGLDDPLPFPNAPRRGWFGDSPELAAAEGDRTGSLFWLIGREKQIQETLNRARDYGERALAWLLEDQVAQSVTVETSWVPWTTANDRGDRVMVAGQAVRAGLLALDVEIVRPDSSRFSRRFDVVWQALEG